MLRQKNAFDFFSLSDFLIILSSLDTLRRNQTPTSQLFKINFLMAYFLSTGNNVNEDGSDFIAQKKGAGSGIGVKRKREIAANKPKNEKEINAGKSENSKRKTAGKKVKKIKSKKSKNDSDESESENENENNSSDYEE